MQFSVSCSQCTSRRKAGSYLKDLSSSHFHLHHLGNRLQNVHKLFFFKCESRDKCLIIIPYFNSAWRRGKQGKFYALQHLVSGVGLSIVVALDLLPHLFLQEYGCIQDSISTMYSAQPIWNEHSNPVSTKMVENTLDKKAVIPIVQKQQPTLGLYSLLKWILNKMFNMIAFKSPKLQEIERFIGASESVLVNKWKCVDSLRVPVSQTPIQNPKAT